MLTPKRPAESTPHHAGFSHAASYEPESVP